VTSASETIQKRNTILYLKLTDSIREVVTSGLSAVGRDAERQASGVLCDKRIPMRSKVVRESGGTNPCCTVRRIGRSTGERGTERECSGDEKYAQMDERMSMRESVEGKGGRGRPKNRWLDAIENGVRAAGVCVRDAENRDK